MPANVVHLSTPPASPPNERAENRQLVRTGFVTLYDRAAGAYGKAKEDYSVLSRVEGAVTNSVESLKPWIPESAVGATQYVCRLGDTALTSVDSTIDIVDITLKEKVISPAFKLAEGTENEDTLGKIKVVANRAYKTTIDSDIARQIDSKLGVSTVYKTAVDQIIEPASQTLSQAQKDGLKVSADKLYTAIQARVQELDLQTTLGDVVETRVRTPAKALYDAALQQYASVHETETVKSVEVYLKKVSAEMGSAYSKSLETPLREFFTKAKEAGLVRYEQIGSNSLKSLYEQSASTVEERRLALTQSVEERRLALTQSVDSTYKSVVSQAARGLDVVLPCEGKPETTETITDLAVSARSRLSKTLEKKLKASLSTVRKFSSERLQDIIHVDLIAYAEQVIDDVSKNSSAKYDYVQEQLKHTTTTVQTKVETLTTTVQTQVETLTSSATNSLKPVQEKVNTQVTVVSDRLVDLRTRLYSTIEALKNKSSVYVTPYTTKAVEYSKLAQEKVQPTLDASLKGVETVKVEATSRFNKVLSAVYTVVGQGKEYVWKSPLKSIPVDSYDIVVKSVGMKQKDQSYNEAVSSLVGLYEAVSEAVDVSALLKRPTTPPPKAA